MGFCRPCNVEGPPTEPPSAPTPGERSQTRLQGQDQNACHTEALYRRRVAPASFAAHPRDNLLTLFAGHVSSSRLLSNKGQIAGSANWPPLTLHRPETLARPQSQVYCVVMSCKCTVCSWLSWQSCLCIVRSQSPRQWLGRLNCQSPILVTEGPPARGLARPAQGLEEHAYTQDCRGVIARSKKKRRQPCITATSSRRSPANACPKR